MYTTLYALVHVNSFLLDLLRVHIGNITFSIRDYCSKPLRPRLRTKSLGKLVDSKVLPHRNEKYLLPIATSPCTYQSQKLGKINEKLVCITQQC